jgi:hypothetical protein
MSRFTKHLLHFIERSSPIVLVGTKDVTDFVDFYDVAFDETHLVFHLHPRIMRKIDPSFTVAKYVSRYERWLEAFGNYFLTNYFTPHRIEETGFAIPSLRSNIYEELFGQMSDTYYRRRFDDMFKYVCEEFDCATQLSESEGEQSLILFGR